MLSDIWSAVISIPDKIKELATSIGNFFNDLGTSIGQWFTDLWNSVKDIFNWLSNFFNELLNFFLHIFVPTDEQWNEITNDYVDMGDTLKSHLPFVSLFSDELKNAQSTVAKNDFLVITIPSFNYVGSGGIKVYTREQKVVNVGQVYEPYRAYIRGGLFLIVVGLAFVYLIKYILTYGQIHSNSSIDNNGGGGK